MKKEKKHNQVSERTTNLSPEIRITTVPVVNDVDDCSSDDGDQNKKSVAADTCSRCAARTVLSEDEGCCDMMVGACLRRDFMAAVGGEQDVFEKRWCSWLTV